MKREKTEQIRWKTESKKSVKKPNGTVNEMEKEGILFRPVWNGWQHCP